MIACLPMYDFPWTSAANDAFWAALRERLRACGIAAPDGLTRGGDLFEVWSSPELLFGQACGYPYWTALRDKVEILATPVYDFEGCEGPNHCSFLVVRRDDPRQALVQFRGARAAINSRDSNSGMNLFRAAVAPLAGGGRFFGSVLTTGAHVASLRAIARGEADIAAIDCVTFGLVARGDPDAVEFVRVLGRTPASPSLPFIASRALPEDVRGRVRAALVEAGKALEFAEAWAALGLAGVEFFSGDPYSRVEVLEKRAAEFGYPRLA